MLASEERTPASRAAGVTRPAWLEGRLLTGLLLRRFGYADEVRGALREYSLRRAAWLGAAVRVYPGAALTEGILANVGLTASYERMFDVTSSVDGTPLPTSSSAWGLGARVRQRLADFELGGGLAYGRHRFVVADSYVPDPDYRFARVDAEVTWRPARFVLTLQLGYRQLFGTGELGEAAWFPKLGAAGPFHRGFGLDGELSGGYSVMPELDLLLGARVLRYRLPLNPAAGDDNPNGVAGSARDLYGAAFVGVGGRW